MDRTEFDRSDFLSSFGQVWKMLMTDPQGFFATMPLTGGLGNPVAFATFCFVIAGVGFLISGSGFKFAVMVVVWGIVRLFFSAALFLLVARKIFAGAGDFEATFRVCAYAAAPVVLLWIPLIRSLAVLYIGYLIIVGLQRAQQFDSVKAVLTVLLSIAIGAFLTLALGGPRHWWWGRRFAALV